jgi:hypothetical protein
MEKKIAHSPTIEVSLWLVLDTHLTYVLQVPTHARVYLGQMIEEAK